MVKETEAIIAKKIIRLKLVKSKPSQENRSNRLPKNVPQFVIRTTRKLKKARRKMSIQHRAWVLVAARKDSSVVAPRLVFCWVALPQVKLGASACRRFATKT